MEGKVAIVTGGTGILGGEMAKGLLQAGADVIVLGRNKENLDKMSAGNPNGENRITGIKCDVLIEKELKAADEEIRSEYGRIDILVNAAGGHVSEAVIGVDQTFFDLRIENLRKVTDLNLIGTVLPTLIFGRIMAEQKSGSVINISSMATQRAITRAVGYSAAKAAVENFTRWMAVEAALKFGNHIRVNAIAPGFFLTDQNRSILTNPDGTLTERGRTIINITPFNRFGEPSELIGTILWLASDASGFVTGAIIPVDGGFSAFSGV